MDDQQPASNKLSTEGEVGALLFKAGKILLEAFRIAEREGGDSHPGSEMEIRMEDQATGQNFSMMLRRLEPDEEPYPMSMFVVKVGAHKTFIVAAVQEENIAEIIGDDPDAVIPIPNVNIRGTQRILQMIMIG